ncbi:hypothetical protein ACUNV4_11755 [Granulosicoccus sp. 3-233]|uniref:hypothetical protein n=1 Tax=Granulosicoccus sp. 3-233 TaxID=3417969 RepID=UPI003D3306EF
MKRQQATSGLTHTRSRLSVLVAGVLAAANVAADDVDKMISSLEETLQPAKPTKATPRALDQAVAAREGLGFRSDRRYVAQLLENPERFNALAGPLTGGHHATPEEVEALKIRLVLQEDAIALAPALSEDPDFAGIYISTRNIINIGFTFNAEKKVEELRQKVRLPDRVQAFQAKRSMGELENDKNRVVDMSGELTSKGIVVSQVAIDIISNRLKIGVVKLDPNKLETIQQLFGDVDIVDKPLNEVENRSDTATPMRAGVRITNAAGGSCTSNWKAQDRTTGEMVTITAGHCVSDVNGTFGGPGADFFQGSTSTGASRLIGTSDQTTWVFPVLNLFTGARTGSGEVDALRAPLESNIFSMPSLYAYDNANAGVFTDAEQARVGAVDGTVVIGSVVCSGGQFSPGNQVGGSGWKNCGSVNAVNVANAFTRQSGSADVFTVLNTNEATYTAIGGDSGAPTWRIGYNSTQGWHGIAVGHHSGGPAGAEIFNDIERVEDALNVDVRFY